MPWNGGGSTPPSPWRTPFAVGTYIAGAFWTSRAILSWLTGGPDVAGVLRLRVDTIGLLYLASAIVGGTNFFGAGVRAAHTLRRPGLMDQRRFPVC